MGSMTTAVHQTPLVRNPGREAIERNAKQSKAATAATAMTVRIERRDFIREFPRHPRKTR